MAASRLGVAESAPTDTGTAIPGGNVGNSKWLNCLINMLTSSSTRAIRVDLKSSGFNLLHQYSSSISGMNLNRRKRKYGASRCIKWRYSNQAMDTFLMLFRYP